MADYGENDRIRAGCEDAAAPMMPVAMRLLHHDSADVRANAAWLLASLRRPAARPASPPAAPERAAPNRATIEARRP